jgi:hypothetical protein
MITSDFNKRKSKLQARCVALAATLGLALLALSGCGTSRGSGKSSTVTVLIRETSPSAVRGATIDVFETHGYKVGRLDRQSLVFEKPGSKWNDIVYGDWMESRTWNRVRVEVETVDESSVRLRATAYIVQDKGGAIEEQVKSYRRAPYQELLDEIAARLNPKPAR